MIANQLRHQRRLIGDASDQGSALLLVLVLLTILSLALGAMFAEAGANLTTSTVVTGRDNKIYAADAGVEIAIQRLRKGTSGGDLCPTSLSSVPTIDGLAIQINLTWPNCPTDMADVTIKATVPPCDQCPPTSTAVVSISPDPSRAVNIVSWVTVVQ